MAHLLITDDETDICDLIAEIAIEYGYTVAKAGDIREARIQIQRQKPDVLLIDMQLPDGDGIEFWKENPIAGTQVVFMTGYSSVDSAIEALRCGAIDYLTKPINLRRLHGVLEELNHLRAATPTVAADNCFAKLIGKSRALELLCVRLEKVAPTRATVLLVGESGTGKELAAEALHLCSSRHKQPFVAVNCGAISHNLIESELFGHEKGSFTGAIRQHKGYFEQASGGTLFLDEVTEMPMELQVRLLRVLETGRFMRVGSHDEIVADVRVVAATNRNPEKAVQDGSLREDLYHRLSVFPLELPPLREREDDIILLAQHFLDLLNAEYDSRKVFCPDILTTMLGYTWPGNVRELRNFVYRSYILSDDVVTGELGAFEWRDRADIQTEDALPTEAPLHDATRKLILATLKRCGWIKKTTAQTLGISLEVLDDLLESHDILSDLATDSSEALVSTSDSNSLQRD